MGKTIQWLINYCEIYLLTHVLTYCLLT